MCNTTSSEIERKSSHQLLAQATHDVIVDVIHLKNKYVISDSTLQMLSPWSSLYDDVNAHGKLISSLMRRRAVLERKVNNRKSSRESGDNNCDVASATDGAQYNRLLNDATVHEQPRTTCYSDVSFCHYDDTREYMKQYRKQRSSNAASNTHQTPGEYRMNYGLHHVIIDSPCKPIRSKHISRYTTSGLPSIAPVLSPIDAQQGRFDWFRIMTSPQECQHLSDMRTFDVILKSLRSSKMAKQVWFDEQGTAYIKLPALKSLPVTVPVKRTA